MAAILPEKVDTKSCERSTSAQYHGFLPHCEPTLWQVSKANRSLTKYWRDRNAGPSTQLII